MIQCVIVNPRSRVHSHLGAPVRLRTGARKSLSDRRTDRLRARIFGIYTTPRHGFGLLALFLQRFLLRKQAS